MKFIKLDTVNNAKRFATYEDNLFVWDGERLMHNNKVVFEEKISDVLFFEDSLFIITNEWEDSTLINPNLNIQKENVGINGLDIFLDKTTILYNYWNKDYTQAYIQKLNLIDNSIQWEIEKYFGKTIRVGESLFGTDGPNVYSISLDTGKPNWTYNLSTHGTYYLNKKEHEMDLQDFIGLYEGVLYLKAGNRLILGLDNSNGHLVYKYEYEREELVLDNLNIDFENQSIFSIGSTSYFELDLKSGKAEFVDIEFETVNRGIQTTNLGAWKNNHIYFWEGSTNNKVGCFDRNTRKIISTLTVEEVKDKFPAILNVEYARGKLYVLDSKRTLHTYKVS